MLYDITRTISPDIAVWPGDTPYSSRLVMAIAEGSAVNVTTLTLSAHTGTHTDAPYHFTDDGPRVGEVSLESYLGPARVISVNKTGGLLPADLEGHDLTGVERLLFHTPASDVPDEQWPDAIAHMTPEMAAHLASLGVKLVGLDSPSMDHLDSKDLPGHNAMLKHGITIIEGLALKGVPDGDYELIALPLKLADSDASPVRAVLRTLES
jgi:arylformamidase